MSRHLEHHVAADLARGMRVLELGSGTGLVGLVAGALGAKVMLTDHFGVEGVQALLRRNVKLNKAVVHAAGGDAKVLPLAWGHAGQAKMVRLSGLPRLIVASDVIYGVAQHAALVTTLRQLSAPGTTILIAFPSQAIPPSLSIQDPTCTSPELLQQDWWAGRHSAFAKFQQTVMRAGVFDFRSEKAAGNDDYNLIHMLRIRKAPLAGVSVATLAAAAG